MKKSAILLVMLGCLCLAGCATTKGKTTTTTTDQPSGVAETTTTTMTPEERLAKKRNSAAINVQLAMAYLNKGYGERAKRKLLMALKQAPNYAPAYDAMGFYLEKSGELDKAANYFEKAVSIDPNSGSSQNNYGIFLCRTGKYKQSIGRFLKAVQDPNYIQTAEAYENAGLCALKIPNQNLAKTYFDKVVLSSPRRGVALYQLANIYFEQNNIKKADYYISQFKKFATPTKQSVTLDKKIAEKLGDSQRAAQDSLYLKAHFSPSPFNTTS